MPPRINLHAVAIGGQKAKSVAIRAARHDGRNLYFMHVIAVAWETTYVHTYACTRPLISAHVDALTRYPARRQREAS